MLFNSGIYIVFLAAVSGLYYLVPDRGKRFWLLITSFLFYMYWSVPYSLLLLICILISYYAARVIDGSVDARRKPLLISAVVLMLGVLFWFKYRGFAAEIIHSAAGLLHLNKDVRIPVLILPLGISFYTFTILGYLIDVYRKKIPAEKDLINYALFVSFFPKLIQGPIERYDRMGSQFKEPDKFSADNFAEGFFLMLWGYFMKIVLADRAAVFVNSVYEMRGDAGGAAILLATILYAFQIYGDFAGYSLIAAGSAKILGIDIMTNFRAPYLAQSPSEFWKRWHISLNQWLRDYIYIPLGGSRVAKAVYYRNIMITFLVSGLWHGANWTFVIWGGLGGLFIIAEDMVSSARKSHSPAGTMCPDNGIVFWKRLLTFILIDFGWLFFRSYDLGDALNRIRRIVFSPEWSSVSAPQIYAYGLNGKNLALLFGSIIFVIVCDLLQERGIVIRDRIRRQFWLNKALIMAGAILFLIIFGIWGSGYDAASFIYTKF